MSLFQIGRRGALAPDDAAGMLLACHARIRRSLEVAERLAEVEGAPPEQVADAASGIRRYFEEALPLHAADEDESVGPRLGGVSPELDAALDRMAREHAEHRPHVERLVAPCRALARDGAALGALRGELAAAAAALRPLLAVHLEAEEATVIPAVRALPAEAREAIVRELRARRAAG